MILRQTLNFAVHLVGGVVVGALAVAAFHALSRRPDHIAPAPDMEAEPAADPGQA